MARDESRFAMTLGSLGVDRPLYEVKAELFKALGHPARIRILELLTAGEVPVAELPTDLDIAPSHLSQHLGVLRRAGVVTSRREGNAVYYRSANDSVGQMIGAAREFLIDALSRTRDALTELERESSQDV